MNPKIQLLLAVIYAIGAVAFVGYAWMFEHLLEPTLPVIPIAAALVALMLAGCCGWTLNAMFETMERRAGVTEDDLAY